MPIQNHARRNRGKIKIMCEEKAPNYGKMQASFTCSAQLKGGAGNFFMTISRFKSHDKYQPVFKTECMPKGGNGSV